MTNQDVAIAVDDFIDIPAWNTFGCVLEVRPATLGSELAVDVLLQECGPDGPVRWYRVEPNEYEVIG